MTSEMGVTAEQYARWSEAQCAGIEIVDGLVLVGPSASKRHNRLARLLANALDAAAVVSPGSETTDRIVKADQYARAGIPFYWRVEQAATGAPIAYTYVLDPAAGRYRDGEVFTGAVKATAPFVVAVDLAQV
jgi:Uma2 family endonuclease